MPKKLVLVIEDEEDVQELVRYNLEKAGHNTLGAFNGEEGLKIARNSMPDLVVLDLILPGLDGLQVCRRLKEDPKTKGIPIVMLTAMGEESDIVLGLEMGADDYITKPFSPRVLLARIRAILRRQSVKWPAKDEAIRIHGMVIDPQRRQVLAGSRQIDLMDTEFRILHFLASRPGWVFTRYQIVDGVHGSDYPVTDRSVDVQIAGLRKKLGEYGKYIQTVRGVGYRMQEESP